MVGFRFHEVMEGSVQREGETFDRPFRFELEIEAPDVLDLRGTAVCEAAGHARIDGLAKHAPAKGRLELSPFVRRRLRYVLEMRADDGKTYTFDGHKTIGGLTFSRGWTTLPGEIVDAEGKLWGKAVLRFSFRRHLAGLLGSLRLTRGELAHAR